MVGIVPIFLLAIAYFVACLYLWSGWNLFLPGANTPFGQGGGPIYGVENIFFQTGKFFYFTVSVFGWLGSRTYCRQAKNQIGLAEYRLSVDCMDGQPRPNICQSHRSSR
jgi:hypothetical protein